MSVASVETFDASRHWALRDVVSLRDESFGALAYHHVNRRLVFLKSRELVELVRRLGDFDSADEALEALIDPAQRDHYRAALGSLAASELLGG